MTIDSRLVGQSIFECRYIDTLRVPLPSKPLIPSVYLLHRTKENLQLLLELNDRRGSDPWLVTLGRKKSRNVSKSLSRFNFYSPFDQPITFLFPSLSLSSRNATSTTIDDNEKLFFPLETNSCKLNFHPLEPSSTPNHAPIVSLYEICERIS